MIGKNLIKNSKKQSQVASGAKRKEPGEASVSNDLQSESNIGNEWIKGTKNNKDSSMWLG